MALKSIKPTLIIGLGKQGRKILSDVKNELFRNFGQLPAVQLLAIDFKDEVLEEEKQRALVQDFFSFRLGMDLLDDWLKRFSNVTQIKEESFSVEYKLREKDTRELLHNVLKKPTGDYINISIEEKPYTAFDLSGLKNAIQSNAGKFESDGINKIINIIGNNVTSVTDKTQNSLREELKNSKLVDKNSLDFLEGLEKTRKQTETAVKREIERAEKECKIQDAERQRFLDETVTESALPVYRRRLIECLEKKLNLMVEAKGYSALLKFFETLGKDISDKIAEIRRRNNLSDYIRKKLNESVREIHPDEASDIYTEQRTAYERLKARIKKIQEIFDDRLQNEWILLERGEEFFSRFTGFCQECFIPVEKRGNTISPCQLNFPLTPDEMILLSSEIPPDMEKRSCTWGEYDRWIRGEIKKLKNREPSSEDIKESSRYYARSVFWASFPEISARVDQKLREVTLLSNRKILNEKGFELIEANDFDIFLIASLYDSLACGIYIDMVYLMQERVIYHHGTSNPFAFLLLPGALEEEKQDKNELQSLAFSSLSELDHFLQRKNFTRYYYPGQYEVEIAEKPFKLVFLIDYINSQGFALQGDEERKQMCREMILAMILTPLGSNLKSLPQITASIQGKISGKNTSYGSFGISLMKFPAPFVRKYSACLLGERILSGIFVREDFDQDKVKQGFENFLNTIDSVQDSGFIPCSPKLDRNQFKTVDPEVLCGRIKRESGLLESRFAEQTEKDFQVQFKESVDKLISGIKEAMDLFSKDTVTTLRGSSLFIEKIYDKIKSKKEELIKKRGYVSEHVKEDEERHFKTFDVFQDVINSFAIPFIGKVIPAKRIDLVGYLSFLPLLLMGTAIPILLVLGIVVILVPVIIVLIPYMGSLGWYLWSWKRYYDKYFEARDSLFNHIDKKILNRGQLISLDFKLRQLEELEAFCRNYTDAFKVTIKKLSDIARDLKEEAEDTKEEIFKYRGALTSLLINESDIEAYRKDSPELLPLEARSLYESLGNWDDPPGILKEKIRQFLWDRYSFIEETSADELLKTRGNSLDKIEEALKMAQPFWTIDEIKLSQGGSREKIYFCGVVNSEGSFLAGGLRKKPLFSSMTCFSMNDPHLILLGQVETGIPLFALKAFSQMKKSYKFLSAQKMFRAFEDANTEPFPLKMTEKYNQIRRVYLPASLLEIYNPPMGMEEEEIYQNLADNPDVISIIEEKLQKMMEDKGSDVIRERLLELMGKKPLSVADRDVIQEFIKEVRSEK